MSYREDAEKWIGYATEERMSEDWPASHVIEPTRLEQAVIGLSYALLALSESPPPLPDPWAAAEEFHRRFAGSGPE